MSQDLAIQWFREGAPNGERFMVVGTDTFDGTVFPAYTNDPAGKVNDLRKRLCSVMEVYDLSKPLSQQATRPALFYKAAWDFGEKS